MNFGVGRSNVLVESGRDSIRSGAYAQSSRPGHMTCTDRRYVNHCGIPSVWQPLPMNTPQHACRRTFAGQLPCVLHPLMRDTLARHAPAVIYVNYDFNFLHA